MCTLDIFNRHQSIEHRKCFEDQRWALKIDASDSLDAGSSTSVHSLQFTVWMFVFFLLLVFFVCCCCPGSPEGSAMGFSAS